MFNSESVCECLKLQGCHWDGFSGESRTRTEHCFLSPWGSSVVSHLQLTVVFPNPSPCSAYAQISRRLRQSNHIFSPAVPAALLATMCHWQGQLERVDPPRGLGGQSPQHRLGLHPNLFSPVPVRCGACYTQDNTDRIHNHGQGREDLRSAFQSSQKNAKIPPA